MEIDNPVPQIIPPEKKAAMSARIAQQQGKPVSTGAIAPSMPSRGKQIAMEIKGKPDQWVDDVGDTAINSGWVDDPYVAAPVAAEQPKPEEMGDTARGFKRAFAQVPELAYGTGALIGMSAENLFGEGGISTATKDYFAQKFQQKQQENQKYAPTVEFDTAWEGLKNGDTSSMADWIQDSAGYVVGQGLQTLATGGVGAVAGKAALTKMLGGMAAKNAEKIVAESAGKIALADATKMAATRMAQAIGAGTVLSAQNLGMEAGDIYGGLIDQAEKTGSPITGEDLLRAWGAAAAAAGTETATDLLGLGALTGRVKIPGAKGRVARGAVAAGVGLPVEAGQEYIQTGFEQYGAGQPLNTPEAARERLNAAAVGGMGGTLVAGGAGVLSPATKPNTPIDQARADAEILKSGQIIPGADESRVKKATLIALYGENNAVRQAIEGDHQSVIDRMIKVAPKVSQVRDSEQARAESVLAKIESAKTIPEEKQTPMQAALAKANKAGQIKAERESLLAKIEAATETKAEEPTKGDPSATETTKTQQTETPEQKAREATHIEQVAPPRDERAAPAMATGKPASDARDQEADAEGKPVTVSAPTALPPGKAGAAPNIAEALNPAIEQLIKLRKNAGQIHMAAHVGTAISKAKAAIKAGGGKAAEFKKLAKSFKGKDDQIHATLMSIANALEPIKSAEKKPQKKSGDLLQRIKQLGGIDGSLAQDITGEPRGVGGWKFAFKKGGASLDDLATQLAADGFMIDTNDVDGGVQQLRDMIRNHIGGERNFKAESIEQPAESESASRGMDAMAQRAEELGIKWKNLSAQQLSDAVYEAEDALEMERLDAEMELNDAEREAFDAISTDETIDDAEIPFGDEIKVDQAAMDAYFNYEAKDEKINDGQTDGTAGEEQAQGVERGTQAGGQPDFALTGQTNAEVAAQERTQREAAEKQAKRDNAPPPSDFTLTGSDRAADVGAARGQTSLLDAKQTESALSSIKQSDIPAAEQIKLAAELRKGNVTPEDVQAVLGTNVESEKPSQEPKAEQASGEAAQDVGVTWDRMTPSQRFIMLDEWAGNGKTDMGDRYKNRKWSDFNIGEQNTLRSVINKMSPSKIDKKPELAELPREEKIKSDYSAETYTVDAHSAAFERVTEGTITADEFKAAFDALVTSKDAIIAELGAMTKPQIFKLIPGIEYRYKSEKKDAVVAAAYRDMVSDFTLGEAYSYGMSSGSMLDSIRAIVDRTTDETLAAYADSIKQKRAEREAQKQEALVGMDNPQTLEDYQRIMSAKAQEIGEGATFAQARMAMTPEQRVKYDELAAEKSRSERVSRKVASQEQSLRAPGEAVETTDIIKTKHTKHGHDLWQFQMVQRVSPEEFKSLATQAKRLGGDYSSYRGNGAIPGWQFRTEEAAKAFKALVAGDTAQAKDVMNARRDAYADDRSQSAVERLTEMADALDEKADSSLNQERKSNTARRARFAASAESSANADKAMAQTMRNIASGIENGTAKMLDRVRQKVQVEALQGFVRTAFQEQFPRYADQEKNQPSVETADYAKYPSYTAYRSDLAGLGRSLLEVEGTKKLGQRLMKVADDVDAAYLKFAKENIGKVAQYRTQNGGIASASSKSEAESAIARSGYNGKAIAFPVKRNEVAIILSPSEAIKRGIWDGDNDKRITLSSDFGEELVEKIGKAARRGAKVSVPWQFENAYNSRKRLAGMNIETPAELRAALREFIGLRETAKEPDKIKQMERAMIGRKNDGFDFFPTPAVAADDAIAAADIKEGMTVYEPQAGMGHMADRIREAGVEPDVGEIASDRRELLEAKGYNIVSQDFMDMRLEDTPNGEGYDRIIMNPPFSDRRDALHVQHAYSLLKPGGRLVSIMGEGVFFGKDKKAEGFREWLDSVGGTEEKLDEGTFLDPSLPVNTGVSARMVVIDKPESTGTDNTRFSQSQSAARNPHTLSTLTAAIDKAMGQGFAKLLEATGKFKIISSADIGKYLGDEARFSVAQDQTDTPAFKKWFGDSKVVDADGKPLVVYHSTTADFESFKRRTGDIGIHFGTAGQANDRESYLRQSGRVQEASGQRIIPVYLSLKNPLRLKDAGSWAPENVISELQEKFPNDGVQAKEKYFTGLGWEKSKRVLRTTKDIREFLQSKGYDGVVYKNTGEVSGASATRELESAAMKKMVDAQKKRGKPLNVYDAEDQQTPEYIAYKKAVAEHEAYRHANEEDSYIAFERTQIKSAIGNRGTFNPTNPDIRYSADGSRILAFVKDGITHMVADNISQTDDNAKGLLMHELGVHALQLGRNDEEFQKILKRIKFLRDMGDKRVKAAFARVPSDTPAHLVTEEAAGYLAESHPDMSVIQKLVARLRALLRKIGAKLPEMQRTQWYKWAADLSVDDILLMAQEATKRAPQDLAGAKDRGTFKADRQSMFYSQLRKAFRDAPDRVFSTGKAASFTITPEMRAKVQAEGMPLFSAAQRAEAFARLALEELAAENDALFFHKKSDSKTLTGVIADVIDGSEYLGDLTREDENAESGADHRYAFKTSNDKLFYVYEKDDGEVWIDVSRLEQGGGGAAIYAALGNYAYNAGKRFIGDPNGLSQEAVVRRTHHMLSSALRFGTTRHLDAAKQQVWGAPEDGVVPLKWKGSDIDKVEAMIHTIVETSEAMAPSLKEYHYDFQKSQFSDAQGRPVTGAAMAADTPRNAGVGEKTARRVTLLRSLLDADRTSGTGGRSGILEKLLSWDNSSLPENMRGLFSKRADGDDNTGNNSGGTASQQPLDRLPQETKAEAARRVGQDAMLRFRVIQDWLKEQGVKLSEAADVYVRENLSKATTANKIEDFRNFEIEPLIKNIAKAGFDLNDITDYLQTLHIPEANARMRKIHNDPKATANGITDAEAKKALAEFQAMPKFAAFKELADEVQRIGAQTLEMRYAEGLVSKEQYDAYNDTYQHWIPLRGNMPKQQGFGRGMSTNAKQKRRFGHEQRDEFIFENLVSDRERAIFQIEHNKLGLSVANFILEANNPDIGTFSKPERQSVLKDSSYAVLYNGQVLSAFNTQQEAQNYILKTVSSKNGSIQGMALNAGDFNIQKTNDPHVAMMVKPMLAENEIQVYINGHAVRLQLNDPLLARAATNAGIEQLAGIMYVARQINGFLSKAYTAWSPDFLFVNPVRDIYQGSVVLTGKEGIGFTGKAMKNYAWAWKELWDSHNDTRESEWVTRYREAGGNTGGAYLSDIERVGQETAAALQEFMGWRKTFDSVQEAALKSGKSPAAARSKAVLRAGLAGGKKIPTLGHFLRLMERLNGVFENTLRLATFKAAIDTGKTDQQAAMLAKDLMNFNRKGEIANQMGAMYLFFNPAIQGSHVVLQSLTTQPNSGQARWLIGGLMMTAFLLAEAARSGDDDDERDWRNIPDYVKARNLVLKFGDMQVTLPVAYGFGIFHSLGNAMSDLLHDVDSEKVSLEMATSVFENFSVFGNPLVEQDGKVEFRPEQLLPTVPKMVIAPSTNLDGLGRTIQPRKFKASTPDSQNMTRSVRGTLYADVAASLNDWTGGNEFQSGAVDVSPNTLKYWVTSITGGAGRFLGDTVNTVSGGVQGVAPELSNMPVARKFIRESDVSDSRASFWQIAGRAKMAAESYRAALREGDRSAAMAMEAESAPYIRLAKMADHFSKLAGLKRDEVERINSSDMPLSEKKARIREIEQREQEIYDQFLKMFDAG